MTSRSDDFNRTDSTTSLGTPSDSGSAWSALSGTWGINTNRGYNVSAGSQEVAVLEASAAVVTVQVTLAVADNQAGLIARAADNSNYLLFRVNTAAGDELYKQVAGSFTLLATGAFQTWVNNDVAKIDVDSGNLITIYKNGSSLASATDSAGSTNTKHGLRSHNTNIPRFDTFSITDNSAAAATAKLLTLLGVGA